MELLTVCRFHLGWVGVRMKARVDGRLDESTRTKGRIKGRNDGNLHVYVYVAVAIIIPNVLFNVKCPYQLIFVLSHARMECAYGILCWGPVQSSEVRFLVMNCL